MAAIWALVAMMAAAFAAGFAFKEVFDSRPAGAAAFCLVLLGSFVVLQPRRVPGARVGRLVVATIVTLVIVVALSVWMPWPWSMLALLLWLPVVYLWSLALRVSPTVGGRDG